MDDFVPPPGLNRSGPRDVRLSLAGRAVVLLAVGLFAASVLMLTAFTGTAARQSASRRVFLDQSVATTAEVVRLWQTSGDPRRNWAQYRFETPAGLVEGRSTLPLSVWRGLRVGSPVQVRYLPSDPSQNYAGNRGPRATPLWVPWLVAAGLAGVALLCLWLVRLERRLLENGRVAAAVVTRHHRHRTSHGGTHKSISYEFRLLSGAKKTGKSRMTRTLPAIGSVIPVVYDSERPSLSRPYPLALVSLRARGT